MQLEQLIKFTSEELELYSRQLLVSGWGYDQQMLLKNSTVLLTSNNEITARYLICAGIGCLIVESLLLCDELRGFELNTKVKLLKDLEKIPHIDLEITKKNTSNDETETGLADACFAINFIAKQNSALSR